MRKRFWDIWQTLTVLSVALLIVSVSSVFWNKWVFLVEITASAITISVVFLRVQHAQKRLYRFLQATTEAIGATSQGALNAIPLPVAVLSQDGEVVWYNDRCFTGVLGEKDICGKYYAEVFPGLNFAECSRPSGCSYEYKKKIYTVYSGSYETEDIGTVSVLYFVDDTRLKNIAKEYEISRPAVMLVVLDNYDELMQNLKESEKSQVSGEIEAVLENWVNETNGVLQRTGTSRYIFFLEERHLQKMIENKFSVLNRMRGISVGEKMPPTLSIGVGRGGKTIHECETMARQSLDMALGRGGDQAAVRTPSGYDFYGGFSKGVEKRTKVKTRIIANAITELIAENETVLIMGHSFSDLDCIGAAVGMWKAAVNMGKTAHIVVSMKQTMAIPIIERLKKGKEYENMFINVETAKLLVHKKTVLIVVDTHRPSILESKEVYKMCKTVVVIDHHRKMVEHIDDAVIFYHEPYSSSTSEMVTELLQYMPGEQVNRQEAEALLAGIMLDTKSFVIKSGVRTFEAAAYLRKRGADTSEVKKLFSSPLETFIRKAEIVSSANIYKGCAIAAMETEINDEVRMLTAQTADELLGIRGVNASFVLCEYNGSVNISARSLGAVNVQVIMEKIGGGGHLTMAGAQLTDVSLAEAQNLLTEAIDKVIAE